MLRLALLVVMPVILCACVGTAPTAGRPEFPLVACEPDRPGSPTAPPGYMLVQPGTIAFGTALVWQNASRAEERCGAQAVSGASSVISLPDLAGEDRIFWVATLARPGDPTEPDVVLPTMTLTRLDPSGPVVVQSVIDEPSDEYSMRGSYGHDARAGSYVMRIVSSDGVLFAEGRFVITP